MFVIRPAVIDDLATLLKLAKMVHFINLPADKDIISAKIARSRRSFAGQAKDAKDRQFMFVLEDTETGNVVGTSAVMCCISWPGWPHVFLKVRRREYYSQDLQQGSVHTTIEFGTDESGPSELGGLILAPGYRGHGQKLGSLLSLVRLHYVGIHRDLFKDRMLAELMGPLTPDSRTMLWEYLGRRFINLSYSEADLFCQHSKEFMTSLWPRGEIHTSILPPEARALIGKVGEETLAARAMLERQGFRFNGHVDPFDGGPYLEAETDKVPLVRETELLRLGGTSERHKRVGIVSCQPKDGTFRAVRAAYSLEDGRLWIPGDAAKAIGAREGDRVGLTPLGKVERAPDREGERGRSAGRADDGEREDGRSGARRKGGRRKARAGKA